MLSSRLCVSRCEGEKSQRKIARAPWRANWCAEARPIPSGEFAPGCVSGFVEFDDLFLLRKWN